MAMLEMDCPSCGERLELDAGFAGGVCRCSNCGTLMTVPHASADRPARQARPAAPGAGAASSRPEAPVADAEPADEADETAEPELIIEPIAAESGDETTSDPDGHVLKTQSGRTVQIENVGAIPTARRKRPVVRAVTAGAVIGVVGLLIGMIAYGMYTVLAPDPAAAPERIVVEHFGYDPEQNVFELESPNVLGLPLEAVTAVIVDASGAGRDWLPLVQDAVRVGLADRTGTASVGLIYAAEPEPRLLAEEPHGLDELTAARLHRFQDTIPARGVAPLEPALTAALQWQPRKVILIIGRELEHGPGEEIEAALAEHGDVQLDIVAMDMRSPTAEALAEAHGGRAIGLSSGQLRRWYRAAEITRP